MKKSNVKYVLCKDCAQMHYVVTEAWALKDSKLTGVPFEYYQFCDECDSMRGNFIKAPKVAMAYWKGQSIPPVVI